MRVLPPNLLQLLRHALFSMTLLFTIATLVSGQKHVLYLLPGLGSDERIFTRLPGTSCELVVLEQPMPGKNETLPEYAQRIAGQIDTTRAYSLLGVSFGGMVAVELAKILQPKHVFLIGSAKTKYDLPMRYRMQKKVPVYKAFGGKFMQKNAYLGAWLFVPDIRREHQFFKNMVQEKDPEFLERAFGMIAAWQNTTVPPGITHLHGTRDHTLPYRKVRHNAQPIRHGSHWMIYLQADEVMRWIAPQLDCQ